MKAFKIFWKVFAVFSSIFVIGFFSYNIWDDYVRTGFQENDGYEWIANKMPEYEAKDLVKSEETPSNDFSDIEAEIEAEMKEKEGEALESEDENTDSEEDPEPDTEQSDEKTVQSDSDLDAESIDNELSEDTEEETDEEILEEDDVEENGHMSASTKTENKTSNCFNIVDGGMTCPKPEEIIYIEAEGGKAKVYLKEGKRYFISHSLASIYSQLGEQRSFYKTKKYLINLNHLIGYIPKGTANSSSRKIDLELIESKDISIPYAHLKPLREQYMQTRGINQ